MSRARFVVAYLAMIAVAVGVYLAIRGHGLAIVPAIPLRSTPAGGAAEGTLAAVLLALAVITLLARALGAVFERWLGQPRVIGEIVAGIVLGPSLLGAVAPRAYSLLLPATAAGYLGLLAKVGVVLFMFLVGLELNPSALRKASRATLAISHASIVVPFLLGSLARARALPALRNRRRRVHDLLALPRHLAVGHGVPGARADPPRLARAEHAARRDGARLRRGRRRDGVDAPRAGRRRRERQARHGRAHRAAGRRLPRS